MYDIIIKNGKIIDGTGSDGVFADVAIKDGKIAKIDQDLCGAEKTIDAKGLVVTPGFIDSHSHSDDSILTFPEQIEKVEQGITTSIGGQCGSTLYPKKEDGEIIKMSAFFEKTSSIPLGSNNAVFAGHSAIRKAVMGMDVRKPTAEEMEKMKDLLRDAMDAGAMGISFGLIYTPSCYSETEELIELARVAKEKGGMIAAHIRDEVDGLVGAVEEFITIAREADVRGVLSHHKVMSKANHGAVKRTIKMMEKANSEGCDIYCDVYPYVASRTSLSARLMPSQYVNDNLSDYMKDPALRQEFKDYIINKYGQDISFIQINTCAAYPQYVGLMLDEVSKLHGKDIFETAFDLLQAEPRTQACYFLMCEEDVKTVLSWERAMICTDSSVAGNAKFYHPRLRGSFPRVLGKYVREEEVTSLPEMIRKMTSLPAYVYSLENKGVIKEGYDADICVFDPETITDTATFAECTKGAKGLNYVIVGGKIAAENAISNKTKSAKVLLRNK